jgi:cytochrome c oxidase subunit II
MVVLMRYALLVLMIGGVSVLRPQAQEPQPPPADLVVKIAAERFTFTPSQVKSQVGKTIEFRLTSDDTMHGFRILETDISIEIPKRGKGEAVVRYTPTEPGTYTFECSYVCGAGHAFMRGSIVVTK